MSAPFWIDVFDTIVTDVRNDATKPGVGVMPVDAPYYEYGHPLDVINKLKQKDTHSSLKFKKYPLIALFQDFTENMGYNQTMRSSAEGLNIVICTNTRAELNAEERYNLNFRTILYPLYDLLIKHLVLSHEFLNTDPGLIPHQKIDRLYWGRSGLYGNEGNIFNDYIDAIEIQNLQLDLALRKNCI